MSIAKRGTLSTSRNKVETIHVFDASIWQGQCSAVNCPHDAHVRFAVIVCREPVPTFLLAVLEATQRVRVKVLCVGVRQGYECMDGQCVSMQSIFTERHREACTDVGFIKERMHLRGLGELSNVL